MKKQRFLWMAGGGMIVIILFVLIQQLLTGFATASPITEEEARQEISIRYPQGDIQSIKKKGGTFEVVLLQPQGTYQLTLDEDSGEVTSLELIEAAPENPEETPAAEPEEKTLTEEEVRTIVEKEVNGAIEEVTFNKETAQYTVIVKGENEVSTVEVDAQNGETSVSVEETPQTPSVLTEADAIQIALQQVDGEVEDVELEQSAELSYYLIEIDNGEDEALIQINALTGAHMATTWDDDEDEDEDEED